MNKRRIAIGTAAVVALGFGAYALFARRGLAPVRLGLLHSRTGPMAISEKSMIDAELLAIKELTPREEFSTGASSR